MQRQMPFLDNIRYQCRACLGFTSTQSPRTSYCRALQTWGVAEWRLCVSVRLCPSNQPKHTSHQQSAFWNCPREASFPKNNVLKYFDVSWSIQAARDYVSSECLPLLFHLRSRTVHFSTQLLCESFSFKGKRNLWAPLSRVSVIFGLSKALNPTGLKGCTA